MPLIFIMRHGQAETGGTVDSNRSLTDYGKQYTRQIGEQLNAILVKHKFQPPRLIHSPYRRAKMTADLIQPALSVDHPAPDSDARVESSEETRKRPIVLDLATPDTPPVECFKALDAYAEESLLLVSHMPLVASLASYIEHANLVEAYPFHTSEMRVYEYEHWIAGSATLKFRLV